MEGLFLSTKLGELLMAFSKKELKPLQEFASLSAMKLTQEELQLLQYLIQQFSRKSPPALSKSSLQKTVFNNAPKVAENWNRMTSRLYGVVRKYIAFCSLEKDELGTNKRLLTFFQERGLAKNIKSQLPRVEKTTRQLLRDSDYHLQWFEYYQKKAELEKSSALTVNYLQKCSEHLELYYVENRLRMEVERKNQATIWAGVEVKNLEEVFPNGLESYLKDVGIYLYYQIYQMLQLKEPAYFTPIYEMVVQEEKGFALMYKKAFYEYLQNACVIGLNLGYQKYASSYLTIIKRMIANDCIMDDGFLSWRIYYNTISAALISEEEKEWINWFAEYYAKYIEKENIFYGIILSKALLAFKEGDIEKQQRQLSLIQFKSVNSKIAFEKLYLKILYTQKEFELVEIRLNSLRRYINRNRNHREIADFKRKKIRDFISYFFQLLKYSSLKGDINIDEMKERLPATDFIWIAEQLKKR